MSGHRNVLAFDLFGTLIDTSSIVTEIARALPAADAPALAASWRAKQLEYTFRLTVMGQYLDFDQVTEHALAYATRVQHLPLGPAEVEQLAAGYRRLTVFADVAAGLDALAATGAELVVLSNGTPTTLAGYAGEPVLADRFARWISVDEVRAYKPAAVVYRYAAEQLGVPVGAIRLVSSNPFDVIGAASAGLATAWIDRSHGVFDLIGPPPDLIATDLGALAAALDR